MAEMHVISALVRKYQEILGQKTAYEIGLAKFDSQLDHIRATIRMFDPNYDTIHIQPKRPIRFVFKRNVFMRCAMDILRDTKEPISARDIVLKSFEMQGAEQDATVIERFNRYLTKSLMARERDGSVIGTNSYPKLWKINRDIDSGINPV